MYGFACNYDLIVIKNNNWRYTIAHGCAYFQGETIWKIRSKQNKPILIGGKKTQ